MRSVRCRVALRGVEAEQGDACNRLAHGARQKGQPMGIVGFNCACYLPPSAKRVVALVTVIIVVVMLGAVLVGHGRAILIMLATSLVTAAVGEGVRAGLRYRPRLA